jgi:hypothetical protein
MPRPAKLPDLSDVDITELKLMILAVLERHGMGPEWRRSRRGAADWPKAKVAIQSVLHGGWGHG